MSMIDVEDGSILEESVLAASAGVVSLLTTTLAIKTLYNMGVEERKNRQLQKEKQQQKGQRAVEFLKKTSSSTLVRQIKADIKTFVQILGKNAGTHKKITKQLHKKPELKDKKYNIVYQDHGDYVRVISGDPKVVEALEWLAAGVVKTLKIKYAEPIDLGIVTISRGDEDKGCVYVTINKKSIPVKESNVSKVFRRELTKVVENHTPENVDHFIDFVKTQKVTDIMENSHFVFIEPTQGAQYVLEMYKNLTLPVDILVEQKDKVVAYVERKQTEGYPNQDHLKVLIEGINFMEQQIYSRSTTRALKESTIEHFVEKKNVLIDQIGRLTGLSPDTIVVEGLLDMNPGHILQDTPASDHPEPLTKRWHASHPNLKKYITASDGDDSMMDTLIRASIEKCRLEFAINFVDTFMDDEDSSEVNMESFRAMIQTIYRYESLMEAMNPVAKAARKVALAGDKAAQKTVHAARKAGEDTRRVKVVAKRIPKHVDDLITNTVGQIKQLDRAERRNKILQGGTRVKVFRLIKNAILIGGTALIHPALAAITLIGSIAIDKKLDSNARKRLLNELEDELKLVDEKVNDARNANDNEKKYELMRIKNKLEGEIRRIQFHLVK